MWAFEPTCMNRKPSLRLSNIAKEIDTHQKGVLSDEMGVGMARWIMFNYFDAADQINMEEALANPRLRRLFGNPVHRGATSPDHIYRFLNGAYSVVECKGTQTSPKYSRRQLRRGLEQVPSITFPGGRATEYVISTYLTRSKVEVRIIDPPPEGFNDEDDGKQEKREINIESEEDLLDFRERIQRVNGAKLLAFAGSDRAARRIATEAKPEEVLRENPPQQETIGELGTTFSGQEIQLRSTDVQMFIGAANPVLRALEDPGYYDETDPTRRSKLLPSEFRERLNRAIERRSERIRRSDIEPGKIRQMIRIADTTTEESSDRIQERKHPPTTPKTALIELETERAAAIDKDGSILLIRN
jgi:hypothetical protein